MVISIGYCKMVLNMKSNSLPIMMFGSNAFTMIQQLYASLASTHQLSMQKCDQKIYAINFSGEQSEG